MGLGTGRRERWCVDGATLGSTVGVCRAREFFGERDLNMLKSVKNSELLISCKEHSLLNNHVKLDSGTRCN